MTMFGSGYSANAIPRRNFEEYLTSGQQLPKPDVRMKVVVSGPEAGYVATPIYLIEVAKLVLENTSSNSYQEGSNKIQPGVYSPSAALEPVCDQLYERLGQQGCKFVVERQ